MLAHYININDERLCGCRECNLSCLEPREWMKNQIGVWEFKYESRDIRDKNLHPATFPIAMARRVIEQFTHRGELVIDPFVGSGTTLVAARDLGRNAIGVDLQPKYIKLCEERLLEIPCEFPCEQISVCDDARNIKNFVRPNSVKLLFTSPPYANLLNRERKNKSRRGGERYNEQYLKVEQYSQDERDLGILEAFEFEKALYEIFIDMKPIFKEKAHIIINITDAWIDRKRVPLHINVINALTKAGYVFRNTIIWDRRNIVNRIGIFGWPSSYITMGTTFEYILDFTLE